MCNSHDCWLKAYRRLVGDFARLGSMLQFLICLSAAQLFQFQLASLRAAPGQLVSMAVYSTPGGGQRLASCQTLEGSFSAVWTAAIARKDAFCSIFRDLQDLHSFPPLQSQILQIFRDFFRENFRIFSDFCKILLNFCVISAKINKILTQICKISDIRMVQKDANLVDFEKCYKMRLCSLS